MKKTLMININGIVFHIDEDAFYLLSQYIERLRIHFSTQEGSQEIMEDIEARIAEILQARCSEAKQVITAGDVNEVIGIMGQPIEIDQEENPKTHDDTHGKEFGEKRFFRNPDERIIGGVCSGIASYFQLDPVWIRLIFIIFIMAGGSGILLYLVLWFVIPDAQTTSEKLSMKGKKINISTIEKSIRTEVSKAGSASMPFFETAGQIIRTVLTWAWKGVVFITGIMLVIFGIAMLLALTAYLFGWTPGFYEGDEVSMLTFPAMARLLVGCNVPIFYLQVSLMLFFAIPLFMIFYNGLRMVFRFSRIRHVGLTAFNIWIIGLFITAYFTFKIVNLYEFKEEKQAVIALENPGMDTIRIALLADDPGIRYLTAEKFILAGDWKTVITDEKELYMVPHIRFEESSDSLFSVSQVILARGKSRLEAIQHLSGIRYSIKSNGNQLNISPFARIPLETCWRGQGVNLLIRVPKGKFVYLDQQLSDLKPDWYFTPDAPGGKVFQMKDSYLEEVTL